MGQKDIQQSSVCRDRGRHGGAGLLDVTRANADQGLGDFTAESSRQTGVVRWKYWGQEGAALRVLGPMFTAGGGSASVKEKAHGPGWGPRGPRGDFQEAVCAGSR